MKKETMYILGGVALVGVAFYLYNKNKPNTLSNSSNFSSLTGDTTTALKTGACNCDYNPNLKWAVFHVINPDGKSASRVRGCVIC